MSCDGRVARMSACSREKLSKGSVQRYRLLCSPSLQAPSLCAAVVGYGLPVTWNSFASALVQKPHRAWETAVQGSTTSQLDRERQAGACSHRSHGSTWLPCCHSAIHYTAYIARHSVRRMMPFRRCSSSTARHTGRTQVVPRLRCTMALPHSQHSQRCCAEMLRRDGSGAALRRLRSTTPWPHVARNSCI